MNMIFGRDRMYVAVYCLLCAALLGVSTSDARSAVIALTGDSTVASGSGWGDALADYFPPHHSIINEGQGGSSTKSFIESGQWQSALDLNADYVFIQFGHNDQKVDVSKGTHPVEDPPMVAPGLHDLYQENLRRMVADVREKNAIPVLITPVARRTKPLTSVEAQVSVNFWEPFFDDFGNSYSLHDYADAVRDVGAESGVKVIDLNQMSLELYRERIDNGDDLAMIGPPNDNSHFSVSGATAIAELVANASPAELVPETSMSVLSSVALAYFFVVGRRRH